MTDEAPLNPYASSTLYEPAQRATRRMFHVPLVARGAISFADRRLALQMAARVTAADWRGHLLRVLGLVLLFALATELYVAGVVVMFAAVFSLPKLARTRWASVSARQAVLEPQLVERHIDDAGVTSAGGDTVPWSHYYTGRISPDLIVLIQGKYESYQIFPRSHFASDNDWTTFENGVRRYVRVAR
jgi:hypothetical protein